MSILYFLSLIHWNFPSGTLFVLSDSTRHESDMTRPTTLVFLIGCLFSLSFLLHRHHEFTLAVAYQWLCGHCETIQIFLPPRGNPGKEPTWNRSLSRSMNHGNRISDPMNGWRISRMKSCHGFPSFIIFKQLVLNADVAMWKTGTSSIGEDTAPDFCFSIIQIWVNETFFWPLRLSVRHISYRFARIEEIDIHR